MQNKVHYYADYQHHAERLILNEHAERVVAFGSDKAQKQKRRKRRQKVLTQNKRNARNARKSEHTGNGYVKNNKHRRQRKKHHYISPREHILTDTWDFGRVEKFKDFFHLRIPFQFIV